MALFKYFYHCCCQHDKEPEKIPHQQPLEEIKDRKDRRDEKLLFLPEESSIIAAPSPHMDDHSDCPKLQIKIIESSAVEIGTVVVIGPLGLEGSKRAKMDGKAYFGSKLKDGVEIVNDFIVDEAPKGFGGRHFLIKYQITKQKYSISDLGDGSGTFVRIDSSISLKDGYIVSYGNSHMTIHYNSEMELTVKFLEGPKMNEVYNFFPSDKTILIGRMVDCRIRFDDSSMSRYQCTIFFDSIKGWMLVDGTTEKRSTNGTWLFVEEEYEIFEGMIFKAGKTLFEAHIL